MRHVATLIAAIVIGPLAWIMIAFGQERSTQAFAHAQGGGVAHPHDFVGPLLLLAGAGVLLGLLASLRLSPLGAVLTGAVYTSSYLALLISPTWLLDRFDRTVSVAGRHADMAAPIRTGTALLLGALLLVAVVSVGRWRRWPLLAVEESETVPRLDRQQGRLGLTDEQDPATGYVTGPVRVGSPQDARR
jgi:hypothetical protein